MFELAIEMKVHDPELQKYCFSYYFGPLWWLWFRKNFQAWFETGVTGSYGDATWGSSTAASSTFSHMGATSADVGQQNKLESTYLYIQMEYCPR